MPRDDGGREQRLTAPNDRIKVGYEEAISALSDPQWETVEAKKLYPTHYGYC
ncbi:hypothetical protein Ldro_2500 [Legionella drozanskii LLAP-1]|uniref:Uncharacterized protein n=1 Tax=Legionella drozanskii LLAP-1 TaxID=1212489 RepID=A0A0W0SPR2_9GAMM|nr:hypothetical protein Ldro_2500 [Legionella drozanskii LLAP-1]